MLKSSTLFAVISLAIPLSGATISGITQLTLTFNPTQDVTIVATDNKSTQSNFVTSGPPANSAGFSALASVTDNPAFSLLAKNQFQASVGPGSMLSFTMEANAEVITLRNAGRSNASVLIDFVLIMNGTAEGPGTAQYATRSQVETRLDSNGWNSIFFVALAASSPGAFIAPDYCVSPNSCSGQLNVVVPANSTVRVRSMVSSEGLVSEPEVPEPSAFLLSGAGLSAVLLSRSRFRK